MQTATQAGKVPPMRRLVGFARATYAWVNNVFNMVAGSRVGGALAVLFSILFLVLDIAVALSVQLPLVKELAAVLLFITVAIVVKSWIPKLKALVNAPTMTWEQQKTYAAVQFYDCHFGWTTVIAFLFVILMFRTTVPSNDKLLILFMLISFQRLWALKTRFTDPLEVVTITWAEWDRLVEAHLTGRERIRETVAAAQPILAMATKANDVPPASSTAKPVVKTTITAPAASAPVVLSAKAAAFVDEAKDGDDDDDFVEDEAGETEDVVAAKPTEPIVAKYYPPPPATISPPAPPVQQFAPPPPAVVPTQSAVSNSSKGAEAAKLIKAACSEVKSSERSTARVNIQKVLLKDKKRMTDWMVRALKACNIESNLYESNLAKWKSDVNGEVGLSEDGRIQVLGMLLGHVYKIQPAAEMKELQSWLESELATA